MNTINILFLSAVPAGATPLELNTEYRKIEDALEDGPNASRFRIFRHARIQRQELERTLSTFQPHIVHFAGHGTPGGSLLLEAPDGQRWDLDRDTLRTIFRAYAQSVKLAVLNACHSELAANVLREVVPYVLGNAIEVFDNHALTFSQTFYSALFENESLHKAFRLACKEVEKTDAARALTPQLLTTPSCPDPREVKPLAHWLDRNDRDNEGGSPPGGTPAAPPIPPLPAGQEPTRADIRMLLELHLPVASDFDAFVIDAFPNTYRRFGSGMERIAKANLLLQLHSPTELREALIAHLNTRSR
nr:CHAT domain-containing protein [Rhodoferax sp.]